MIKLKQMELFVILILIINVIVFSSEPGSMRLPTRVEVNQATPDAGWAEKHIQKIYTKEISPDMVISGNFQGSRPLTRGELAVMISRVLPSDIVNEESFTEEYNAVRYYKEQAPRNFADFKYWDSFGYVERVTKRGIMAPIQGKFNPEEKISRGEFLKTLLILLEKTTDPFVKIQNIACDATKLTKHLTNFTDVSVVPSEYAGWLRMAQEYNILPQKDEVSDFVSHNLAIPYNEVFYNFTTRRYEFQPDVPITRELAVAIFSNLFAKWDGYGDYIPFDAEIGNTSKDIVLKTIKGDTKVDCELIDIDTLNNEVTVKYQERKTEFRNGKIFNTVFLPGKTTYKIADNAFIWVILNGKDLMVRGDNPVERLKNVIERLKDESIFDIKVNFMLLPESHKYNISNKILVKTDSGFTHREVIGYMEVNLIPYDYIGRVVAKTPSTITIFDSIRGNLTLGVGSNMSIVREVTSVDGASGTLTEKIVTQADFSSIKEGEQIKLKIDKDGNIKNIVSRLLRIGAPSNIDVRGGYIKTQYLVGEHFRTVNQTWDSISRTGLKVYGFDYDFPGNWRNGMLDVLFSSATTLRKVDLYVQPAEIVPVKDGSETKNENKIFFIEAIPN